MINVLAITAIVFHISTLSLDVYTDKLVARCTVEHHLSGIDTMTAWVKCEQVKQ